MADTVCHLCLLIAFTSISSVWKTEALNVTLFNVENTIYTLSDELVDANTAASKCKLLGGALALVKDQVVKDKFYQEILNQYYNPDLQRVHIFYDKLKGKTVYKFSNDSAIVGGWKNANELGQLSYLDFYKNITIQREVVYFCKHYRQRWRVVTPGELAEYGKITDGCPTSEGWHNDFHLYTRNSSTKGHQPIYNFWRSFYPYGSMLTDVNSSYDGFDQLKKTFHLPVRSVFVGARYNTSSNQWLWSDGTNANFTKTPTTCKQKAFSYGITELENRNCTGQLAYYSCEVKLNMTKWITTEECNSTVINVNWSNDFNKEVTKMKVDLTIKIEIERKNSNVFNISKALQTKSIKISGLQQRTSYRVKVTIHDSNSFIIGSTHNLTTGYGIPDPVTDAYVKTQNPCVITFNQTMWKVTAPSYKITATDSKKVLNYTITKVDVNAPDVSLNISGYDEGADINFTIQAFNCEGGSDTAPVQGFCVTPLNNIINTDATTTDATTTDANTNIKTNDSASITGGAVGAVIFALLLVVVSYIVYRRYGRDLDEHDKVVPTVHFNKCEVEEISNDDAMVTVAARSLDEIENPYENTTPNRPQNADKEVFKLRDDYKKKSSENCKIFKSEFQEIIRIDQGNTKSCKQATLDHNAPRNRYKNILTCDHSRVILVGTEGNDYINASYIPGYKQDRKFIATQGPKPNTISDFWLMVWQQESPVIVMLTGLSEYGKKKCDLYWPDLGREETYGLVIVALEEEIHIGGIVRRKFTLKKEENCLSVVHFQYTTWPDHGIPVTTTNMIYLRKMVEENKDSSKPLIIHCSAGVGRTGTYIAMDTLFNQLDAKENIDVSAVVSRMRENRTDMVQTPEQYKFIHKLLAEHEMFPDFDRSTSDLQSMTEDELNRIELDEFYLLAEALGNDERVYDSFCVATWVDEYQEVVKLNASFIQDLGCPTDFIASQQPTSETEQVFWKGAVEKQVNVVVSLQDDHRNPFPTADSDFKIKLGDNVNIQITSAKEEEDTSQKSLWVEINGAIKTAKEIHYLAIKGWSNPGAPSSVHSLLEAIEAMHELQRNATRDGRVLVCCKDGLNRTGTFIALVNILERLMAQNKVDVFRTVKDLRDMRPNMVDNLDSYMFIYNAVLAHLSSANPYEN